MSVAGRELTAVNVTMDVRGSKVEQADLYLPASDAACGEELGPALRLAGVTYPCRRYVPELPGLQAAARAVNDGASSRSSRASQRARIRLLRRFVAVTVVDPAALPRAWWTVEPLLAQVRDEAARLCAEVYEVAL